jgi:pyruvate dehydrogenase E1 component
MNEAVSLNPDDESLENLDWVDSLRSVIKAEGPDRAAQLLGLLEDAARSLGVSYGPHIQTPYVNSLPALSNYPGDLTVEQRIENMVRWNAMAMVVRANREEPGIGGHISTFASCATLYEVAQNHFLRGRSHPSGGDHVYFQGHASPGNYARAFLEGRLSERALHYFRRELSDPEGLSSYPHPWLMKGFWEFPTVSMGLGPLQAVYRARFQRYLESRELVLNRVGRVWAFVGDGECDEPETLAGLALATREKLDNLIFVVNCNLQRLDGPVHGNGKIVQELEVVFRGLGWNVIKVIWGSEWDPLFEEDKSGALRARLTQMLDGDYQKLYLEGVPYLRNHVFFGSPELEALGKGLTDEQLGALKMGGHDQRKVFAAYDSAVSHKGAPSVILAQTVKGYGLGAAGEGMNITHQQKKLSLEELRYFRDRLGIPIPDEKLDDVPFFSSPRDSAEIRYLEERRHELGGFLPARREPLVETSLPAEEPFQDLRQGFKHPMATTMALVRLMSHLLHDGKIGKRIVPIVPDEARTFGMDALFQQCGIYSSQGQLYEPVDAGKLMAYRESKTGQLLEEGITEAGGMGSFLAAATAYSVHGVAMLPFFFFYSMFGFQRVGDLIWAAGDSRARGFLIGATAGRTTLAGEGLQHQDGNSHVLALPSPTVQAYDPAFAFEISVIVQEGIRRILGKQEDLLYYLTVGNEAYLQPAMPLGVEDGILRGIYLFRRGASDYSKLPQVQLMGSGAILPEALRAQEILSQFGVNANVWSVTSYKLLHEDALEAERWNRLHPKEKRRVPYLTRALLEGTGSTHNLVTVAASDYLKALPDMVARWVPGSLFSLGTDGFGRSDSREKLRGFFEVGARDIAETALFALSQKGKISRDVAYQAILGLHLDPEKGDPRRL